MAPDGSKAEKEEKRKRRKARVLWVEKEEVNVALTENIVNSATIGFELGR